MIPDGHAPISPGRPWPRLVPPIAEPSPRRGMELLDDVIKSDHWSGAALDRLARRVGGVGRLAELTTDRLPPVCLDLPSEHPAHEATAAIVNAIDAHVSWLVGDEERTVIQRIVQRLAGADPRLLDLADPRRTAASVVWLVLRSRETGRRSQAGWVWSTFRVEPSVPHARAIHRALGFRPDDLAELSSYSLPDPDLLTSTDRRRIVTERDSLLRNYADHLRRLEESRPLRRVASGQVEARTHVVRPLWSVQGTLAGAERRMVMIAVDHVDPTDNRPRNSERASDDVDEVISLTVPDAWLLLRQLQHVLGS